MTRRAHPQKAARRAAFLLPVRRSGFYKTFTRIKAFQKIEPSLHKADPNNIGSRMLFALCFCSPNEKETP